MSLQDPTNSQMSELEKETARISIWISRWSSLDDNSKKEFSYDAFFDWGKDFQGQIIPRLDKKMANSGMTPPFTNPQRKTFVIDNFTLAELSDVAEWLIWS